MKLTKPKSTRTTRPEDLAGRQIDIIVIGSGAAGLSAAITAAEAGLSVVVLEKESVLGGTSAISGGWAWVPGIPAGEREGDTRADTEAYIEALAGDSHDPARAAAFLDAVPQAIDFLTRTANLEVVDDATAPDYQQEAPGARSTGRAITFRPADARILGEDRLRVRGYHYPLTVFGYMPEIGPDLATFVKANRSVGAFTYVARKLLQSWGETAVHRRSLRRTNGNALMTRMVATCQRYRIPLVTEAAVTGLVRNAEGAVTGVKVNNAVTVVARRSVILAAGGFGGDAVARSTVFNHDRQGKNHNTATQGHAGDSLRLAREAGGMLDARPHSPAAWAPVTVWRNLRGQRQVFPHLRAFGLPGLIAVNRHGRRFGNESLSYHDFGRTILADGQLPDGSYDPRATAWIVADRTAMRRYGIGYAKPWPLPTAYYERVGYLTKSPTLAGLAEKIGVPADELARTVAHFNEGAERGEDPDFGRGSSWYHKFKGDADHQPNPNLAPLTTGPFYAVKIGLGDLGTFAGLAVDEHSRVVTAEGEAVSGLYAVGSAAVSPFMGGYPGYGACIGPALVFGYAAARHIADATDAGTGGVAYAEAH